MKIDFEKSGSIYIRADDSASFREPFILTTSNVHFYSYWSDIPVQLEGTGRSTSTNQGNLWVSSNPPSITASTNNVCIPLCNSGAA
jgi:hypothetical protein